MTHTYSLTLIYKYLHNVKWEAKDTDMVLESSQIWKGPIREIQPNVKFKTLGRSVI